MTPPDTAATCEITTPHAHSSFDDPIDCAWRDPRPTTDQQWAAVRVALKARDMPLVVKLLHPLAVSDPRGVELFMAVIAASSSREVVPGV